VLVFATEIGRPHALTMAASADPASRDEVLKLARLAQQHAQSL
jgi:hypothetical protein